MVGDSLADTGAGVQEGDVLAGKYRVERVLGVGGMGVVVAAHHIQLDEKVALKFLLPEAVKNAEALARFEREARAAVKIKSEHVARVSDVGKLENGAPYMVMEYLEGGDLSGLLQKQGKLPVDQAVSFVLQAGEAIAEAHSLGIVHRDLKPSNLFCIRRRDGQFSIKVLDFGISKLTSSPGGGSASKDMGMTKTTAVVGSPVYMSPEQMQSSKGVDHRTDIWSMGIILYELLSGRVPFEADTVTELAVLICTEPVPPMGAAELGLPPGLEQVVLHCLEKSRDKRHQTISDLAEALSPFAPPRARLSIERIHGMLGPPSVSASSPSLPEPAPAPAPAPAPVLATSAHKSGSTVAEWHSDTATRKHGGKATIGIAVAAGVAVLLGGVALIRKSPAPAPAPAAAQLPVATPASVASAAPVATKATEAPPQPASPPPTASAAPVASPAAPLAAQAAPASPPAAHHVASPAAGHPAAAASASAATGKSHSCNPPYFFDAQGNRVFKTECL
jgi:serine/threonine-protein kinase